MTDWPVHARIDGPIVMIGFGSIGKGTLPLIERHIAHDRSKFVVIDPDEKNRSVLDERGIRFINEAVTRENFDRLLKPLLTAGPGPGFLVNLSVDVSSTEMMRLARECDAFYIDTVAEPWAGFYTDPRLTMSQRSNYALRESVLEMKGALGPGRTAVNCCGANPGMVSWLVKQALLNLVADLGLDEPEPTSRKEWALLMMKAGVKGIHIAERDTQRARKPKERGTFVNTWSVDGFIAEGLQPAELGWGTHEKALPPEARAHDFGCGAGIYLTRPGAGTLVRSWTPTADAQHGWLITHNEAISIADFLTRFEDGKAVYRPTVHYAYHPCDAAVLSLHEFNGRNLREPEAKRLMVDEVVEGMDELGVLLCGHAKGAYWYGSQLTIEEARDLVPHNNATSLQVTAACLAGMIWAIENPHRGVVEAEEMDHERILELAEPYLGQMVGAYTEWTPLEGRESLFPEDIDRDDPWQFKNVRVV